MNSRLVRDITLVLGIALLARLMYLAVFGGLDNDIHDSLSDQYIYLDIAGNLADGDGFSVSTDIWVADPGERTSIMPPLYPVVLGLLFEVTGESLLAVRVIQLVLSSVLAVLAYLIAGRFMGRRWALLAGMLAAVYPALVMYVRPAMSENLFFPLVALLVYLTFLAVEERPAWKVWVIWGGVAGLAVLTRTEAGILVMALLAFVVIYRWYRSRAFGLARPLLALVVFGLVLTPYALYNLGAHGTFSPLPNAKWKMWDHTWWADARTKPEWEGVLLPERIVVPDWDAKTEAERDAYLSDMAIEFVKANPVTYLKQRASRLFWSYPLIPLEELRTPQPPDGRHLGATSLDDVVRYSTAIEKLRVWSFRLLFAGALAGVLLGIRRRETLLLGAVIGWNALHSAMFVGSERLRLQIDLFLIVLTVACLAYVWEAAIARSARKQWGAGEARAPVST